MLLITWTLEDRLPRDLDQGDSVQQPPQIEMLFWESQNWESGGGRERLTLWADGRSEIRVVADYYSSRARESLSVRPGWEVVSESPELVFLRRSVYPQEVVKEKIRQATTAGIHRLETFDVRYVDGGGTLVGVLIDGELHETLIPMFLDEDLGTPNHERFLRVAEILGTFDRQAFDYSPPR